MSYVLPTFLALLVLAVPINGSGQRKLDEVPGSPNTEIKCGTCPACNNPCNQSPPPPAPTLPPPPPPPKKPPTPSLNCPPPPSYIPTPYVPSPPSYIPVPTGPPGNLYPVNPYISGCDQSFVWSFVLGLPLLVASGLLGMLVFW